MGEQIIYNYEDFKRYNASGISLQALFCIVEYSPQALGYESYNDSLYQGSPKRYSLFRNECLEHPKDYSARLDNHIYRIWTTTPQEIPW